ncbi:unnamed protein product [Cyprideis torosa]|uniref:Uncharacterized protein n=1 Tax=Cyprideis torosa TaxID=163714 RepID=A0A7R8ZKG2_9CRUS|nr:unnamed protein product [Cyprideis torosa]CAG0890858.1 unnamed protein product [Cyprideis torosa]
MDVLTDEGAADLLGSTSSSTSMGPRSEDLLALTKSQLFNLREAIVVILDVLQWKQDWFPVALTALVTISYYVIWWHEMTVLSVFALSGLILLTFDFLTMQFHSMVEKYILPWNDKREKQFEFACVEVMRFKYKVAALMESLAQARDKNQAVYYSLMFIFLFSLSWLGSYLNNFFLCYLVTLLVLLFPGLVARGIYEKHVAKIFKKVEETVRGFTGKKRKPE